MHVSYRHKVTFFGMLVGAVAGGLLALLWLERVVGTEDRPRLHSPIHQSDLARIAGDTFSLIRQINALLAERRE